METAANMKVTDILGSKAGTLSFEFFPPKTEAGKSSVYQAADSLAAMGADYFSVTYGAGGSTGKATLEIVKEIHARTGKPTVHHYTCIKHTRSEILLALREMSHAGVRNILAMRGDPPLNEPNYRPGPDEPRFGFELVKIIREFGDTFAVGVPGFPEKHVLTPTKELDSLYMKVKQDAGAQFIVTQLFFDTADYYEYVNRVRAAGVTLPVIPGILPITDYRKLVDFCQRCSTMIAPSIKDAFEPLQEDPKATYEKGIEVAVRQCQDLLDHGAPGLHLFCLNRTEPTMTILKSLKMPSPKRRAIHPSTHGGDSGRPTQGDSTCRQGQ